MGPKKHPLQTYRDQLIDGVRCACGERKSVRSRRCRRCARRLAQARYKRTKKGQATQARYAKSAANRAASARYLQTPRGQKVAAAGRARRIFIGRRYQGHAQTIEQAVAIRHHVKERIREFKQTQTRSA